MSMFKKLYEQPVVRYLVYVFGIGIRKPHRDFTPYFQYRIESYRPDFFLYFPKPPYYNVYKNEWFRKLISYHGYELTQFLDFHYQQFADKKEFLRFLHYEVAASLKARTPKTKPSAYWDTLETCLLWVNEQKDLLEPAPPFPGSPVPEHVAVNGQARGLDIESHVAELMNSFAGRITLNNHHHLIRVIQVLILLKDLSTSGKKPLSLFNNFSTTDLAAILRQFEELKDLKVNTIQSKISEANAELQPDDPKTEKLIKALTDFFY